MGNMMSYAVDRVIIALAAVIVLAFAGMISQGAQRHAVSDYMTGFEVKTANTTVVIQSYVSISKSDNLSQGINFGQISSLPTVMQNATLNYNATDQTEYYISVSNDSNVNVDFCMKADALNTTGGSEIPLFNYKWNSSTATNMTKPAPNGTSMAIAYGAVRSGMTHPSNLYFRFWLNISASQAPGTYNNTVFFQGVPTGDPCT